MSQCSSLEPIVLKDTGQTKIPNMIQTSDYIHLKTIWIHDNRQHIEIESAPWFYKYNYLVFCKLQQLIVEELEPGESRLLDI